MKDLFDLVEPLPTTELISNYWHFLKAIPKDERTELGPIEVVLKSRTVARGWPVALKNQTLALVTEAELSTKSAVVFVDIAEVSSVAFFSAHMVLPFVTAGALSRSPLERRSSHDEAKRRLLEICESIKRAWAIRIFFEADPISNSIDELLNLNEVMFSVLRALEVLKENAIVWAELQETSGFHVINATNMKDLALSRRENGAIELSFKFSRALPKNLDEKISTLFVAII